MVMIIVSVCCRSLTLGSIIPAVLTRLHKSSTVRRRRLEEDRNFMVLPRAPLVLLLLRALAPAFTCREISLLPRSFSAGMARNKLLSAARTALVESHTLPMLAISPLDFAARCRDFLCRIQDLSGLLLPCGFTKRSTPFRDSRLHPISALDLAARCRDFLCHIQDLSWLLLPRGFMILSTAFRDRPLDRVCLRMGRVFPRTRCRNFPLVARSRLDLAARCRDFLCRIQDVSWFLLPRGFMILSTAFRDRRLHPISALDLAARCRDFLCRIQDVSWLLLP
jgi:hypothetical protein